MVWYQTMRLHPYFFLPLTGGGTTALVAPSASGRLRVAPEGGAQEGRSYAGGSWEGGRVQAGDPAFAHRPASSLSAVEKGRA